MEPEYGFRQRELIRFSDTDMLGHVNNVAFLAYFESGRTQFLRDHLVAFAGGPLAMVAARVEIDFLAELHWPGEIEIGTRVERVGNTSIVLDQAVRREDRTVARAKTVLVVIDRTSRRPAPVPDAVRAALT
jgi:acyl-CoA thioester hydrolase